MYKYLIKEMQKSAIEQYVAMYKPNNSETESNKEFRANLTKLRLLLSEIHTYEDSFSAKMTYKSMFDRGELNTRHLTILKRAIAESAPKQLNKDNWS